MDKPHIVGNEITVRISVAFQEAPDLHTLLAMTPVRERGKLVRLALARYIAATNHPAGDVDNQIAAVSQWLRHRALPQAAANPSFAHQPSQTGASQQRDSQPARVEPDLHADTPELHLGGEPADDWQRDGVDASTDASESLSIRRWLTD